MAASLDRLDGCNNEVAKYNDLSSGYASNNNFSGGLPQTSQINGNQFSREYRKSVKECLEKHINAIAQNYKIDKNKRRKTLVLRAYDENQNFFPNYPYDDDKADDEQTPVNLRSLPPTYSLYATFSMLFCLPVGIYAAYHAMKGERAIKRLDVQTTRIQSIATHRFATLAICYGLIFWSVSLLVFYFSPEILPMLAELIKE